MSQGAQPNPAQVPTLTEVIELLSPAPVRDDGLNQVARPAAPVQGTPAAAPIITRGLPANQEGRAAWAPMTTVVVSSLAPASGQAVVSLADLPVLEAVVPEPVVAPELAPSARPAIQPDVQPAPLPVQRPVQATLIPTVTDEVKPVAPVVATPLAPAAPALPDISEAQLAQRMGVPFVDLDHHLEKQLGCSIRQFFEAEGEERFRTLESEALADIAQRPGGMAQGALQQGADPEAMCCGQLAALYEHLLARLGESPSLESSAQRFGVSPATLKRQLAQLGTHHQAQLDQVRAHAALYLLSLRGERSESVARQLGFHDKSNFRRSFKRWTGLTPGAL